MILYVVTQLSLLGAMITNTCHLLETFMANSGGLSSTLKHPFSQRLCTDVCNIMIIDIHTFLHWYASTNHNLWEWCTLLANCAWWRHQMETFSALLAICAGNSPVTGEFTAKKPVTRSFDVFFDLRLNEGWVNNHEAGDLRRHSACYDVIAMICCDLLKVDLGCTQTLYFRLT